MSELPQSLLYRDGLNSITGLILVAILTLVFCLMRAVGMLGPSNLNWMLPLGFCLMAIMPWILLKSEGRKQIGLKKSSAKKMYWQGILLGALAALICFAVGFLLFGTGHDNWYISIANNYRSRLDTSGFSLIQLHLVFTIPALIFSPIGEEIFFRGLLQRTLEDHLTHNTSAVIECGAFGIVHLCHHGLLRTSSGLIFQPVSGPVWVLLMFLTALLFVWIRKRSGSIYPAILSHAAFNLTMNVVIFSVLW